MPENTKWTIRVYGDRNQKLADYTTDTPPDGDRLLEIIELCLKTAGYPQSNPFSVRVEDANACGFWLHCGPQAPKSAGETNA